MKIELKDATFIIPYKLDTQDRLRNLGASVRYLKENLDTNILICEQNGNTVPASIKDGCQYIQFHSNYPVLHDTKMMNTMTVLAKTPIIISYDCDILLPKLAYQQAYSLLAEDKYDIVYPYDGRFLNISADLIDGDINVDKIDQTSLRQIVPTGSVGGAIFYNKNKYMEVGMDNEKIIGWGYADNERFHRFKMLLRVTRTKNPLFHIKHRGGMRNPFLKKNKIEFERIQKMSLDQLKKEIESWPWRVYE